MMSSLHTELQNLLKSVTRDLDDYAKTVSQIDDMVRSLIQGIENDTISKDDIVSGLEDIKNLLY